MNRPVIHLLSEVTLVQPRGGQKRPESTTDPIPHGQRVSASSSCSVPTLSSAETSILIVSTMIRLNFHQYVLLFLLLAGFTLPLPVQLDKFQVWFTYQSQSNSLSTWFVMLTLCLAPLATHIVFGLPEPVILRSREEDHHSPPSWSDRLTHFNPVSILWRYYAIADRRSRARRWDALDMAACNAAFWDGRRWDGSEMMMMRSREWNTRQPQQAYIGILSGSCLATIVITLQGVQAITSLLGNFVQSSSLGFSDGLPGIFQPLALLGLLRLQSAFWLSNDCGYVRLDDDDNDGGRNMRKDRRPSLPSEIYHLEGAGTYRWWIFRIWWAISLLAITGLGLIASLEGLLFTIGPSMAVQVWSSSEVVLRVMYCLLTGGCLVIHLSYLFRRSRMSTIIPCIQDRWYKAFTGFLIAVSLTCFILSALETKQFPDGTYATMPAITCNDTASECQTVDVSITYNFTNITR